MTTDVPPVQLPQAPTDVDTPTSSGVEVAPKELATVNAGEPRVDKTWFSATVARCGDTLDVRARLTAEGFDGTVNFRFENARSGANTEDKRKVVNGALVVKQKWVVRKFENTWDEDFDVTLASRLMDEEWGLVNSVHAAKPLRIVRPVDGYSPMNIQGGKREAPRWVYDNVSKAWTKTSSGYGWEANYDVEFKQGVVSVIGKVKLVPVSGLVLTAAMKSKWKAEIEGYWNNVFRAHRRACGRGDACTCDVGCCLYEIKLVCNFVDKDQYTTVEVHPGVCGNVWGAKDWWNCGTWFEFWSPVVPKAVRAHEFGHSIGFYDEYKEGAIMPSVDPNTFNEPTDSIMAAGDRPMDWHFKNFLYVLGVMHNDKYKAITRKSSP